MFNRVYKRLLLNSYKPYTLSKLNLWNILNTKHTNIGPLAVTWYVQGCKSLQLKSILTWHPQKQNLISMATTTLVLVYIISTITYLVVL